MLYKKLQKMITAFLDGMVGETQTTKAKGIIAALVGGVFALALIYDLGSAEDSAPKAEPDKPIATFIPKGHVLVPVELVNFKSIDSVLGAYGVVDLYALDAGKPEGQASIKRARIVRSPKSPGHYGVLSPSDKAHKLMELGASFYAVVQNPHQEDKNMEFAKARPSPIEIVVGN